MSDLGILILLGIVLVVAIIGLPQLLIRRAVPSVIKVFMEHSATSPKSAMTAEELGLAEQKLVDKLWKPRDYKPRALQLLLNANVVQMTAEGKLYISEEKLRTARPRCCRP